MPYADLIKRRECERRCQKNRSLAARKAAYARTQAWRLRNKEAVSAYKKKWQKENAELIKQCEAARWSDTERKAKIYARRKAKETPHMRARNSLRSRIHAALRKGVGVKSDRTLALLGMDLVEFDIYIRGQFSPGMTWENYGRVWELDHVRPCASFDLTDPKQQQECFNWSNHQPLFVPDNRRKGARYVSSK